MMAAPSQVAHNASSSDKGGAQILKPSLSSRQCGKLQAKTIRYHIGGMIHHSVTITQILFNEKQGAIIT